MCGEKARPAHHVRLKRGSPPRVRGKVADIVVVVLHGGITPACAGKRPACRKQTLPTGDHPRVCGEKLRLPSRKCSSVGSPPRVRGKALAIKSRRLEGRITPACAGKSPFFVEFKIVYRDHPRVCGEKLHGRHVLMAEEGSPPRVRGKGLAVCKILISVGITPACAGKRRTIKRKPALPWDHPRVCGEKTKESLKK